MADGQLVERCREMLLHIIGYEGVLDNELDSV